MDWISETAVRDFLDAVVDLKRAEANIKKIRRNRVDCSSGKRTRL